MEVWAIVETRRCRLIGSIAPIFDALQSGNPRAHKIGGIARSEELLASVKDALGMLVPSHFDAVKELLAHFDWKSASE